LRGFGLGITAGSVNERRRRPAGPSRSLDRQAAVDLVAGSDHLLPTGPPCGRSFRPAEFAIDFTSFQAAHLFRDKTLRRAASRAVAEPAGRPSSSESAPEAEPHPPARAERFDQQRVAFDLGFLEQPARVSGPDLTNPVDNFGDLEVGWATLGGTRTSSPSRSRRAIPPPLRSPPLSATAFKV